MTPTHTEPPLWDPSVLRANKRAVLRTISWTLLLPGLLAAIAAIALGIDHERPVAPDGDRINTWRTFGIAILAPSSLGLLVAGWMRWLGSSTNLEVTAQREKLRVLGQRLVVKIGHYTTGQVDPDDGPRCYLWLSWVNDVGERQQAKEFFLDPEDALMRQIRALPCTRVNAPEAGVALYRVDVPVHLMMVGLRDQDKTSTTWDPIFESIIQTQQGLLDAQGNPYSASC